jgi:hypothetical protein
MVPTDATDAMERGHGLQGRKPMVQMTLELDVVRLCLELMRRCDPTGLFTSTAQADFEKALAERGRQGPAPQTVPICGGQAAVRPAQKAPEAPGVPQEA